MPKFGKLGLIGLAVVVLSLVAFTVFVSAPTARQAQAMTQADEYSKDPAAAKAALLSNPNDAVAHEGLALSYMRGGTDAQRNWPEATKHFREVVRIDPTNVGAQMMLSVCLRKTGQKAEAIGILKKFVNDKTYGAAARKALAKLQQSP